MHARQELKTISVKSACIELSFQIRHASDTILNARVGVEVYVVGLKASDGLHWRWEVMMLHWCNQTYVVAQDAWLYASVTLAVEHLFQGRLIAEVYAHICKNAYTFTSWDIY